MKGLNRFGMVVVTVTVSALAIAQTATPAKAVPALGKTCGGCHDNYRLKS